MGIEARRLGSELLAVLRDLVVLRVAPDAGGLVEGNDSEIEELRQLASRSDAGRLRRMFRALVREQEDLAWAPQPFAVLEMAVVRLATTAAGEDVQALLTRLDALERRLAGAARSGDARPASAEARAPAAAARAQRGAAERSPSGSRSPQQAAPTPTAEPRRSARLRRSPIEASRSSIASALSPPNAIARSARRSTASTLGDRTETSLVLRTTQPFAAHRLERRRADLEAVCARLFGRPMRIEIAGPDGGARSDAEVADDEAIRQRRRDALAHPAVNTALEILGGEVLEIRTLGDGGRPDAR